MTNPLNPKQIQRRTVQMTTFEDGLWDILTGLIFLLLGIYPLTRVLLGPNLNLVFFLAVMLVFVFLQVIARRHYSEPRLGVVKMRPAPSKVFIVAMVGLLIAVSLALGFSIIRIPDALRTTIDEMPAWFKIFGVDLLASLLIMVVYSLMGFVFGVPRLYIYGWLIGVGNLASVILSRWYGLNFNLPLVAASLIILAVGVNLFVRFLRKYPLPSVDQEAEHV